jgi:peptide-methionine (S)-S-oxide reductase
MFNLFKKSEMPVVTNALPGRSTPLETTLTHFVHGTPLKAPYPEGLETVVFGLGCFWGAERIFWKTTGVYTTAVGYSAGYTPNPTYEEVCSGATGHNEVVLVVYDPGIISFEALLKVFFENHDPTQGMRQGNDRGTQYRSGIYLNRDLERETALRVKAIYETALGNARYGAITTEILSATEFYFAEGYHQQYLAKNLNGYCGIGGTGVSCPL